MEKDILWLKGILLGLVAGITAVALPEPLGLGVTSANKAPKTRAMTMALYLAGGLAASAASKWIAGKAAK